TAEPTPDIARPSPPLPVVRDELWMNASSAERANSGGLRALGALADLELDLLVLLEGAEARTLDLGVVDEDVSGAVLGRDEAEPLLRVEPLHSSLCHSVPLLFLPERRTTRFVHRARSDRCTVGSPCKESTKYIVRNIDPADG